MTKYRKVIVTVCFVLLAMVMTGCGNQKKGTVSGTNYYYPENETETTTEEAAPSVKAEFDSDTYMIISNDMTQESMILRQMASGKQYFYYYSLTTRFLDKYGNNTPVSSYDAGRLITINERDSEGKIKEARISDEVWEYENVVRYEIDEERGVFQIADTKYSFDEDVYLVSDERRISFSDLKEEDEIRVIGMNKEILSVAVTTGHGTIELQNTEIFEGSFVQIGRKIFAEITGEMALEVPEGTYTLSVANKGYGGSKEVTVERNKTLVINLDELKGEGPKKGNINFIIASAADDEELDAVLKIDGKEVGYDSIIQLDYGIHSIQASASGYADFSKKLFVNSAEATITISLEEASDDATSTVSSSNEAATSVDGSLAGSQAGSLTGNTSGSTSSSTTTDSNLSEELTSDYLSTFTELLGNLF